MSLKAVVRKEFKSRWEGRTPLTPNAIKILADKGINVWVERSPIRIFEDRLYADAGAHLVDRDSDADIVLGIKEPQLDKIGHGQIHIAFSHTIKGQDYNMPLLRRFLDQKATLIDYETIKDNRGIRLIAFGRYAGIAGAVDTFHVAGRRLALEHKTSVLQSIQMTHHYSTSEKLKAALEALQFDPSDQIRVVVVGTGNVGKGAVEVCEWLGLRRISVDELKADQVPSGNWFAVLGTEDIVRHREGGPYDKAEYREHGSELYESCFDDYLGKFDILLQTPYWEEKYPYQLPRETFVDKADIVPKVIGDISCDIEGSLACTLKESSIDVPAFTYYAKDHHLIDGVSLDGPSVMSIGHLPCELSIDASNHFSRILVDYLPEIIEMDLEKPLEESGLCKELQGATIVYRGQLTEPYQYLEAILDDFEKRQL